MTIVKRDLAEMNPQDFVAKYFFDNCPYVFSDRDQFVLWKRQLSQALKLDSTAITIVGSAALGLSLNPHKNYKAFNTTSDIDVAVISLNHFNIAWATIKRLTTNPIRMRYREQSSLEDHKNRLVFWGTIATDKLLGFLPFAGEWNHAAAQASKHHDIAERSVGFRLYADYESLRAYQENSVKRCRQQIQNGGA